MSGVRRVWTVVAAALLSALTVLLLCRHTVADPAYYTGAVREADGYQRVYDEVLPDPAVRRALRTGALGVPLGSDAVVDNLPLLVPRPALEQAADRQARALVAALTGTGRPTPGLDAAWRGPVTESATEAGSDRLRALRADVEPAAARSLTHLIARLRTYATPSTPASAPPPTSALRSAVAGFVHDTWPPGAARRIMTALDGVLPGAAAEPPPAGGESGAGVEAFGEVRPPLVARGDAAGRAGPPLVAGGSAEARPPLAARPGAAVVGAGGAGGAGTGGGVQALGEARVPLVAGGGNGAGAEAGPGSASGLPGWVPGRGAVVRTVLAASASWWAVAGVAAAAAGAGVLALRAAGRGGRPRARTAAAVCGGAAALTAAAGTAVWATLPASAGLVPDGLPPSVSGLLTDVVAGLYREAALAWAAALLTLTLTAATLPLIASAPARRTLHRTLAALPHKRWPATRAVTTPPHHSPPRPARLQATPPNHTGTPEGEAPESLRPPTAGRAAPATPPPADPDDPAAPLPKTPRSHPTAATQRPLPPTPRPAPAPSAVTPEASRVRRGGGVVAALLAAVVQVWVLVGVPSEGALACNGDIELCDRPYDRVVQVGSHNAMATVPDGFLGAHQDVSLTGQLDRGARALLLDTHYWETAERLLPPAGTGGLDAAARATLVRAVDSVVRPRPGTWLCHGPCRMGATPLTAQLRELRGWLEAHPRDVVTLILQDAITPADTARAFRAAGLGPYLHRPAPDPAAPWPTLGEMADSGRRLVVFAEEADGPAPWYRNFYDYAVETPYRADSADDFRCAPHRGGSDPRKRLFLLNHFVTRGTGAPRTEAAAVNDADVIVDRARTCALLRGRLPTIVAVNHLTLGDAVGAVRRLNAEAPEEPEAP
jgi:hypothetical protein